MLKIAGWFTGRALGFGKRICGQCRPIDEATFRLYFWVGARGAPCLVTEGGPTEDVSSPSQDDGSTSREEQQEMRQNRSMSILGHLRNRSLSVSTVGTTSTAETAIAPPNQPGPNDTKSSAESSDAPLNKGGLKRPISTLTFNDLTPQTRTAFPSSEAAGVPPAYARPRSEVGLPPVAPGETTKSRLKTLMRTKLGRKAGQGPGREADRKNDQSQRRST